MSVAWSNRVIAAHAGSLAVALVGAAACVPVPISPGNPSDASPPRITLGSAGLKKDFLLNGQSTTDERRRAKRSQDVLVVATAEDNESGIQSVTLAVTVGKTCGTTGTNQPLSVTVPTHPTSGHQPVKRSASYMIRPATLRAQCAQAPEIATVSISAIAVNGVGRQSATPEAIVSSYGPDFIRVATFNLYQPGNHPDSVYERWGRQLASLADIVVLTEVPDLRRATLVASQSGLSHVAMMTGQADVAILSRAPMRDPQERIIDQPGRLSTNDSNVFTVLSDLGRFPHRIIANHWGIRDADQLMLAHQSSSGRLMAANAVIALAGPPGDALTFIAGDMNAFIGAGPQDHDDAQNTPDWLGSTIEMNLLHARFGDPFTVLGGGSPYCSNKRIDFVLAQGAYIPVSHEACFSGASPSDHPFVLVRFEAGDR